MTHPDPVHSREHALIVERERDTRNRSRQLENAGKLPHGFTDAHYGSSPVDELRDRWPSGERLKTAWRLAKDLDTLEQLLASQPVDPSRIDQDELQRALEPRLVQLVRPVDLLTAA